MKHNQLYTSSVQRSVLPNGLRIISEYVPTVESFALGMWINAGSRDEGAALAGTAHFIEHLIFRRSRRHSARHIAAAFENIGAYTNAFTTKEHTCFYVRALKRHFRKCASLLGEISLEPAFHPADIEKERDVILEEIKGYDDEPEEQIFDEAERRLFAGHSLAHPIAGQAETVAAITRDDITEFHTVRYSPSDMIFAVAGNISHTEAIAVATSFFGAKRDTFSNLLVRSAPNPVQGESVVITKSFQQSHIVSAARIEGAKSPDRYTYAVLNTLFGDGMSSRLYQRLRERSGLAYSVYSTVQLLSDCGTIAVYAGVDTKNTDKARRCIVEETDKLLQTKVTDKETARAKEQVKASIVMGLEDMSSRMNYLAKSELEEGGFEPAEAAIAKVDTVTAADVLRVAQTYLAPAQMHEIVFRPMRKTEK